MSNESGEGVKLSSESLPDGLFELLELRSLQAVTAESGMDDYAAGLRDRIRADLEDRGVSVEEQAREYIEELRPVIELGLHIVLGVRHDVRQGRSASPDSQRSVQRKLGESSFYLSHTKILFIHEFEGELPPDITDILRDYPRLTLPEIGEQNRRKATTSAEETERVLTDVVGELLVGDSPQSHVGEPAEGAGAEEVFQPATSEDAQSSGQYGEDGVEDLEPESTSMGEESELGAVLQETTPETLPEQDPAAVEQREHVDAEKELTEPVVDTPQDAPGTVSDEESTDSEQPAEVELPAEESADATETTGATSRQYETEEKSPEFFGAGDLISVDPRSITTLDPSQAGLLERAVTAVNGKRVNLKPEDVYLLAAFKEAVAQGEGWLKLGDHKDTPLMWAIAKRRGLTRPQSAIYNALQRLRDKAAKNNWEAHIKRNDDNTPSGNRYMLVGNVDAINFYLPEEPTDHFSDEGSVDSTGDQETNTADKSSNNSGLELTPIELEKMVDRFSDVKEERRFFSYLLSQGDGVPRAEITECYMGDLRQFMSRLRLWAVKNKGEFEVDTGLESGRLQIIRLDG